MFLYWIKTRQKSKLFKNELHRRDRKYNLINLYHKRHYITKMCFLRRVFNSRYIRYHKYNFTNLLHPSPFY